MPWPPPSRLRRRRRGLAIDGDDVLVAGAAAEVALRGRGGSRPRVGLGFLFRRSHAVRIMPGVQKPHCRPCFSQKASWSGWSLPFVARPSIVVTVAPSAWTASTVQDFTAWPSTSTVQAPHWLVSQPTLVPVRPERLAKEVDEQQPGLDLAGLPGAVHGDGNRDLHGHLGGWKGRAVSSSPRDRVNAHPLDPRANRPYNAAALADSQPAAQPFKGGVCPSSAFGRRSLPHSLPLPFSRRPRPAVPRAPPSRRQYVTSASRSLRARPTTTPRSCATSPFPSPRRAPTRVSSSGSSRPAGSCPPARRRSATTGSPTATKVSLPRRSRTRRSTPRSSGRSWP